VKVNYYSKYSDKGPSSRYRVFQFLEAFRKAGVDVHVQPLLDDSYFHFLRKPPSLSRAIQKISYIISRFAARRKDLSKNDASLSVIEHQLFPYFPFGLEKSFLPYRYIIEMDDAIYFTHPKKMPREIQNAAAIIVGNRTLADYATQFNQNVHVIPTVLNTDLFCPQVKRPSQKIRIGWSGLEYNFKYLRKLEPVFLEILKYPVEIVILSGSPPNGLSFPFRFEKWDPDREVSQINEFDIGIMPLEMDEWCKAKCGMKLLQYMAVEIPAVVTPIGVNTEMINEGENGFTANRTEDWIRILVQLIENSELRSKLGKAGRKTVIEKYSLHTWFPKLLQIYQQYAVRG
jgi:glycosyltransferase involved in cell wall biosynthesis